MVCPPKAFPFSLHKLYRQHISHPFRVALLEGKCGQFISVYFPTPPVVGWLSLLSLFVHYNLYYFSSMAAHESILLARHLPPLLSFPLHYWHDRRSRKERRRREEPNNKTKSIYTERGLSLFSLPTLSKSYSTFFLFFFGATEGKSILRLFPTFPSFLSSLE